MDEDKGATTTSLENVREREDGLARLLIKIPRSISYGLMANYAQAVESKDIKRVIAAGNAIEESARVAGVLKEKTGPSPDVTEGYDLPSGEVYPSTYGNRGHVVVTTKLGKGMDAKARVYIDGKYFGTFSGTKGANKATKKHLKTIPKGTFDVNDFPDSFYDLKGALRKANIKESDDDTLDEKFNKGHTLKISYDGRNFDIEHVHDNEHIKQYENILRANIYHEILTLVKKLKIKHIWYDKSAQKELHKSGTILNVGEALDEATLEADTLDESLDEAKLGKLNLVKISLKGDDEVVLKGKSAREINVYASKKGWTRKKDGSLFGYYFVDNATKDSYETRPAFGKQSEDNTVLNFEKVARALPKIAGGTALIQQYDAAVNSKNTSKVEAAKRALVEAATAAGIVVTEKDKNSKKE